jgi:hypothetical protein
VTRIEFWQIVCALIAIAFAFGAVIRLVRTPRWHILVLLMQLLLIPETALVVEVLRPGPLPDPNELLTIVAAAGGAALLAMAVSFWRRRKLMTDAVMIISLERQHRAAFVARTLTVLMISGFLFTFAPWFAVANLLANAAWIAIWVPRRLRLIDISVAEEIAASPHAVFEKAIDTINWPGMKDGSVTVEPAGPLRVGSELVSRQSLHRLSSNPRLARSVETKSVVTAVVPDQGYTTVLAGHPDVSGGLDLSAAPGGTRATSWSKSRLSLVEAASGLAWEVPTVVATRQAEMRERLIRIKQAAEGPASQ